MDIATSTLGASLGGMLFCLLWRGMDTMADVNGLPRERGAWLLGLLAWCVLAGVAIVAKAVEA